MRTTPFTMVAFLFSFIPLTIMGQETITASYLENIVLDGATSEWDDVAEYKFSLPDSSLFQVSGDFNESDLIASMKVVWNEKALYFAIEWQDDVIDHKAIPKDSSTYLTDSGRRRDRMYLYDNLKLQIRFNDINYVSWFGHSGEALQWHSLRGKDRVAIQTPPPSYSSRQINANKLIMEIEYLWEHLQVQQEKPMEINLLLLFSDQDIPLAEFSDRTKATPKYISTQATVTLSPDR